MKPQSARAKGKRLEREIASLIRRKGLDEKASRMPLSGADSMWKGDIRTRLPYSFEAKNQERIQLWDWWDQTRAQCPGGHQPILCISGNFRPILAVIDIDLLLNLLRIEQDALS